MLGGLEETAFEEQAPKPKPSEGRNRKAQKAQRHLTSVFLGAFCCAQPVAPVAQR